MHLCFLALLLHWQNPRLHFAFALTRFRLASAALSVIFYGKGLRVAEYMFIDAILDKLLKRMSRT